MIDCQLRLMKARYFMMAEVNGYPRLFGDAIVYRELRGESMSTVVVRMLVRALSLGRKEQVARKLNSSSFRVPREIISQGFSSATSYLNPSHFCPLPV